MKTLKLLKTVELSLLLIGKEKLEIPSTYTLHLIRNGDWVWIMYEEEIKPE